MVKLVSFRECKDGWTYTNQYITDRDRDLTIISIDAEKALNKTQHLFITKTVKKLDM